MFLGFWVEVVPGFRGRFGGFGLTGGGFRWPRVQLSSPSGRGVHGGCLREAWGAFGMSGSVREP